MDFAISANHSKNKRMRKKLTNTWILLESLKTDEHESDDDVNCNWFALTGPQRLGKGIGGPGNQSKNRNDWDHSFVKIDQNAQKSPGNLMRLAVSQTPANGYEQAVMKGLQY